MDISKEIQGLKDEVISLRRHFHMYPELGLKEVKTAETVEKYLNDLGIETKRVFNTGVVGLIKGGKPGKTLLLRSDMDALLVTEENDVPYKSKNEGIMHACGHDTHMAMLLCAAKVLSAHKDELCGNVKLVFEPNEEDAGARFMVSEGVLENPKVDMSFAIHIWTQVASGMIGLTVGPTMAEMYSFKIKLRGKGGHTSAPQDSIDPIICAANVIQSAQVLQTREIGPLDPTVVMFGTVNGGTSSNIIPETVELTGTLRYLYDGDDDTPQHPRKRFKRLVESVAAVHRVEAEVTFELSNYTVKNHPESVAFIKDKVLSKMVDSDKVIPYVCMGGEDFSEFMNRSGIPGALLFVGTGDKSKGTHMPHHCPTFSINEDDLLTGVEIHVRLAMEFLQ